MKNIKACKSIYDLQKIASEYHDHKFLVQREGRLYIPEEVASWRGAYNEPTLLVTHEVSLLLGCDLWKILEDGLCNTHRGYKGGEYNFEPYQKLWVDNYGEYNKYTITSYEVEGEVVILNTEVVDG